MAKTLIALDTLKIVDSDLGLVDRINACMEFGMKINIKKTKMKLLREGKDVPQPCRIDGEILEKSISLNTLGVE